jgi:serine/threonine protein kinase
MSRDLNSVNDDMSLRGKPQGAEAVSIVNDGESLINEPVEKPSPDLRSSDKFSERYQIQSVIGQGGMGEVLLAIHMDMERKVAIKRIKGQSNPTALGRFLTEARSVGNLKHNNIVTVHDYGHDEQGPYLVMEYVDGGTLADRLKTGAIPVDESIRIISQVCEGLGQAHAAGIIHRDIKPGNILLTSDGVPKLADFGLARAEGLDAGHTVAGAVLGTIDFMPPEQRRDVSLTDARSDLWSLAATFYQMITGKSPRIIRFDLVPKELHRFLQKAFEDSKENRFQDAASFSAGLKTGFVLDLNEEMESEALEFVEGVCVLCSIQNGLQRKFCKKCAATLRVNCQNCNEQIPVWDQVCGECGSKQTEFLLIQQRKIDEQLTNTRSLMDKFKYDEAITLLEDVTKIFDPRLANRQESAEKLKKQIIGRKLENDAETGLAFCKAGEYFSENKSRDAWRAIEGIDPIRLNQTQLEFCTKIQEVLHLEQAIKTNISAAKADGRIKPVDVIDLFSMVVKYLELNPKHLLMNKLRDDLITRLAKVSSKTWEDLPIQAFISIPSVIWTCLPNLFWIHLPRAKKVQDKLDELTNSLTVISPETAKKLAEWKGEDLNFNGLTSLSPETAEIMAAWKGSNLYLSGLTRLSPETVGKLAEWKGRYLYLNGLTRLSPETVGKLAEWKGSSLYLNGLTRLSPETAEKLAEREWTHLSFDGLTTLSPETAEKIAKWKVVPNRPNLFELELSYQNQISISLGGLTSLSPETAEKLAEWKGSSEPKLYLNGLTSLSPETAEKLAEWKGSSEPKLYLNGLTSLSPETAEKLAGFKGYIFLDGLTTLCPETAEKLAGVGCISLDGLTTLSREFAEKLAESEGMFLSLDGLTTLSLETAVKLAEWKGRELSLFGLTTLSLETAEKLAEWKGESLLFNDLTVLSPETAEKLAEMEGDTFHVYLNGLTSLSLESAIKMATWRDEDDYPSNLTVNFNSLTSLSPETAEKLAECKGYDLTVNVNLNGLTSLSPETAEKLAEWELDVDDDCSLNVYLNGLTSLSPEVAEKLAKWKGHSLYLNGLTSLSPELAEKLAEWESVYLNGLTSLSPELAEKLAEWKGDWLYLNGLTWLSPELAEKLAEWKGYSLCLNGLTSLSPESAEKLAERKGGGLYLDGLTSLSPELAEKLAEWKGNTLCLNGLTSLSPESAEKLAERKGGGLYLDGLTSLSPELAEKLAEWNGCELSLNGLTTLSLETAEKLAEANGEWEYLLLNGSVRLTPELLKKWLKGGGRWTFEDERDWW